MDNESNEIEQQINDQSFNDNETFVFTLKTNLITKKSSNWILKKSIAILCIIIFGLVILADLLTQDNKSIYVPMTFVISAIAYLSASSKEKAFPLPVEVIFRESSLVFKLESIDLNDRMGEQTLAFILQYKDMSVQYSRNNHYAVVKGATKKGVKYKKANDIQWTVLPNPGDLTLFIEESQQQRFENVLAKYIENVIYVN